MPDISDLEMYSLKAKVFKPPTTSQKMSVHGFVTLGGRIEPIANL